MAYQLKEDTTRPEYSLYIVGDDQTMLAAEAIVGLLNGLEAENADLKQRLEMHKAEAQAAVMQRNQAEQTAREAREITGRVLAEKATWISVGERLPTEPNDVLVLGDVGITTGYYIQPTEQIYGRWAGNSNVTHWMPLPERPQGSKR